MFSLSSYSDTSISSIMGVRDSMEDQLDQMRVGMLDNLQQSILDNIGSLNEQQELQVRKVVEEFSDSFYKLYDLDLLAEAWEQRFRSEFSTEEIDDLINFYKSDLGQKSNAAMASANLVVARDLGEVFNRHGPTLMSQYVSKLRAAIQCCNEN